MITRISSGRITEERVQRLQDIDPDPDLEHHSEGGEGQGPPCGGDGTDRVIISDEARDLCAAGEGVEAGPPVGDAAASGGDYARGVFDRARKSGLILRPPPRDPPPAAR